ncbi:MAG: hypothetical protein JWN52_968 [Actinomycetia bacterium]|nr:hypothetical protein [Actinomycetes bacterium]
MRTWTQGTARAVVLTASFVALGAGTVFPTGAFADTTSGKGSVLGGNQIHAPISAPIDISGNAAGVAGESAAHSKGGSAVYNGGGHGGGKTSGEHSVAGGNQVIAPISAPINACGNAVAIFGTADAGCKGGASTANSGSGGGGKTSGKGSVLGGNQVIAPISAPIDACGNAVAVFGSAEAGCKGGATVLNSGGSRGDKTNGKHGVGSGNQVYAPVSAPVNLCGNSAAIFGEAVAGCKGGAKVHNGGGSGKLQTSGKGSVLGGNQVIAPISAPIDACGNAIGNAAAGCKGGTMVHNGGTVPHKTSGKHGVGSGNQVYAPVGAPISACGNAAAVLGDAAAMCHGGSSVTTTPGDPTTSGKNGVLSGNQAYTPVNVPVNVCGNAVAVLGEAAAGCVGGTHAHSSGAPNLNTSGKHGVGAGNQIVAPVTAPVDICGNVIAVIGVADPGCGAGGGGGGYGSGHSRAAQKADAPGAMGLPVLPMLPELTKAQSAVPATAVPSMPMLPAQAPVGLPVSQSASARGNGPLSSLPVQAPQLPTNDPAGLSQLSVNRTKAAALAPEALLAPGAEFVGALPMGRQRQAAAPAPGAPALPDLPTLPVAGDSLPVGGHLAAPQIGGVTDKASGLQQQVGGVRLAADSQPRALGMSGTSLYVLVVGSLLAGVAAAGGAVRRICRR